ncbi:aminodeoxychorismate synthase component I [Utexia brackfieldae]|uniref:aminodeoxychorismate synthase component I n=1 Tax=Utexia brackfieldae TaxID=3074108 RepID=UPI00370DDD44
MLRLDFLGTALLFKQPIKVIQTNDIDQVIACLAEVEQAVDNGYYAVGYIAYEAAPAFNPDYAVAEQNVMPLVWFGIYKDVDDIDDNQSNLCPVESGDWQPSVSQAAYQAAIAEIKHQIAQGNTYQTNYTIRLNGRLADDPYTFYAHLKQAQQADYCAYLDIGDQIILSASPELFFHYKACKIITKPMKGTSARGLHLADDEVQKALLSSEKNHAENMMIVDLLRNDLNRIAKTGSVHVDKLFSAEKYPTVWQMTSTISADIDPSLGLSAILSALFPCGSITGAPKESTMQIIRRLEGQARGVYCGTIGIIKPNKEMIFNVAIRTLVVDKKTAQAQYGVGGGITWDSTTEDEYQEIIHKAQVLYDVPLPDCLLESLLLDEGKYFLLDRHLQRLADSAAYFRFRCDIPVVIQQLNDLANKYRQGQWKVRLLMDHCGHLQLNADVITSMSNVPLYATWSAQAVNSRNRFLYHKTTRREFYPAASLNHEYLLFNERDEITEFVNGNVALFIAGQWLTPSSSCGLLAGTMRAQLVAEHKLTEAVLTRADLAKAEKIVFMNSVRKWREVIWQTA